MALSVIQRDVERSIYEAIRLVLVSEGYLPDITTFDLSTTTGQTQYQQAVLAIANSSLNFATELFGASGSQSKGLKKVPRIVIVTNRVVPGDVGYDTYFEKDSSNPDIINKVSVPDHSAHIQLDIHLVMNSSEQDRVLNALVHKAIGIRKHLKFYNSDEYFFMRQYDYYDVPDTPEGIEEKVYSYEVTDLLLFDGTKIATSLIKDITVETSILELQSIANDFGYIIGPYISDGGLTIDLSGIKYS